MIGITKFGRLNYSSVGPVLLFLFLSTNFGIQSWNIF